MWRAVLQQHRDGSVLQAVDGRVRHVHARRATQPAQSPIDHRLAVDRVRTDAHDADHHAHHDHVSEARVGLDLSRPTTTPTTTTTTETPFLSTTLPNPPPICNGGCQAPSVVQSPFDHPSQGPCCYFGAYPQAGCCPYVNGVCCNDNQTCCPQGTYCTNHGGCSLTG